MLKSLKNRVLQPFAHFVAWDVCSEMSRRPPLVDAGTQLLLALKYQELHRAGAKLPGLSGVEFRNYSQNGEDGILLYIFALIGITNRRVVEVCAGDGIECNAANLIVNHQWDGLLVDGSEDQLAAGRAFYNECRDTKTWPPKLVQGWVTAESINEILTKNGFTGDIDLLSLDLDGVDYWIWNAIECVNPRVVIVEYADALGPDLALTVPYRADFTAEMRDGVRFCGASLGAFNKLAKKRGYRYVGSQALGFNAFFVKNGLAEDALPEVPLATNFGHPRVRHEMAQKFERMRKLPWQEV